MAVLGLALGSAGFCAEPLEPIPAEVDIDPAKVELGKTALQRSAALQGRHGVMREPATIWRTEAMTDGSSSVGVGGKPGLVNSPTVFNARFNIAQFWDGRAETLEEQIDGPIQSEIEMANLWPDVITMLNEDKEYPALFAAVYPDADDPISRMTIQERDCGVHTLPGHSQQPVRQVARWRRTGAERGREERIQLFKLYGCSSCHQGRNVGGNMFQVFGVLNEYFTKRGNITKADMGRFNITGNEEDRHAFKVPSLRMAAHTAPYLHDGSAKTLRDAVDAMFEFQLGRTAPDSDKDAIVAFIKTLAGETGGTSQ